MGKIRVLIVDDSIVVRRLVTDVLSGDPDIEVAGVAPNGRIALSKIGQLNPDVVTLDIEMPELDGLATLREIRKTHPRLPVIMFSTLTERGATATLDALAAGATDYVTKPANVGSVMAAMDSVRAELIPRIRALCPALVTQPGQKAAAAQPQPRAALPRTGASGPKRIDLIAIGISTGGPNALADVFATLPGDLPVPIVIVQHMPPVFTRHLATRLDQKSAVSVHEAAAGDILRPGGAWIAPGDFHMCLTKRGVDTAIQLHQGPFENSCRPAVDVLFRSAAEVYGPNVLAIVMTGMGQDGQRGSETIHAAGGRVVIQDEATSIVWGMPGAVARAGIADSVLPLSKLSDEIVRVAGQGRAKALAVRN